MFKKKSPYKYGVPYQYGGHPTHMDILRVWALTYKYMGIFIKNSMQSSTMTVMLKASILSSKLF